ncbi:transposase [Paraburkholderia sediminicola]|uniref:transposase n=1 Tax=Paraburkholderia TaxID=1822464 RepID=UPI0038BD824D
MNAVQQYAEKCVTDILLSDADWARVEHLFPGPTRGPGRPRRDCRGILNAILWVQQNGEKWHRLPSIFPAQQTCYVKYLAWRRAGLLQRVAELIDVKSLDHSATGRCDGVVDAAASLSRRRL